VRTRIRRATLANRDGAFSSRTAPREAVITAGVVLATSLAFSAGGLLLLGIGGLASLFAVMLLAFGAMGCVQSLLIACGRGRPPGGTSGHAAQDPRRRAKTKQ